MATFYLIRHAQKDAGQRVLSGRTPGIGLSAHGARQAEAMARMLSGESIRHVFSSPMERARATAEPLARERGLGVQLSEAISEVDYGEWTGRTFDELADDADWKAFNSFRSWARIPGGEAMLEVQARFVGEMLRLWALYPKDGVVLVSHGDPIRVAISHFLGAPLDLFERMEIGIASVSVVVLDEFGARVVRLNHTAPEKRDE